MNVTAILLAAGEGRRLGGPKALLPLSGGSALAVLSQRFARPGVARVVAVLGAESERVRREAGLPDRVDVAVNEAWREGMLSSVLRGLDEAEIGGADAVLVHPIDCPSVSGTTIDAVLVALARGATIAVPAFAGRRGHPAGFSRRAFSLLRAAPPARGARAVLADHPDWVEHVPAGPDCLGDLDTPADLAAAARAGLRLSSPGLTRDPSALAGAEPRPGGGRGVSREAEALRHPERKLPGEGE